MKIIGRQQTGVGLLFSLSFQVNIQSNSGNTMETYDFSELSSVLEEDGYTFEPIQTADQFLEQEKNIKSYPLAHLADDLGITLKSLVDAITRFNHEGGSYRVFSMVNTCHLIVDDLVPDTDCILRGHEARLLKGSKLTEPHTRPFSGMIQVPQETLYELSHCKSTLLQNIWETRNQYIEAITPIEIKRNSLLLDLVDIPVLKERIHLRDKSILTPKLVKSLHDFDGDTDTFLTRFAELEEENKRLQLSLKWHTDTNFNKLDTTKDKLTRGLLKIVLELDAEKTESRLTWENGRPYITKIETAVRSHLGASRDDAGLSNLRNLISTFLKDYEPNK